MGTIIFVVLCAWVIIKVVNSNQLNKAQVQALVQKMNNNLESIKNHPEQDDLYGFVMTCWAELNFPFFLAKQNRWFYKSLEICDSHPDKMIAWRMFKDFQDKNIFYDTEHCPRALILCKNALFKTYRVKETREFIVSLVDQIVAKNTLELFAIREQIFSELYQRALSDLETVDLDNQIATKVIALDVGRLIYRGKITFQDEQKIQNDILVRTKK